MGNPSAASNALGIIAHGPASAGVAGSSQSTRSLASYRVSPREGVYPYDIPYDSACFRGGAGGDVDAFIGGGDANGRPPRNGVSARASSARVPSAPLAFDASLSALANVGIAANVPFRSSAASSARALLFVDGVAVDVPLAPLAPSRARAVFPRAVGVSNAPGVARAVGGDANDASAVTRRRFAAASIVDSNFQTHARRVRSSPARVPTRRRRLGRDARLARSDTRARGVARCGDARRGDAARENAKRQS